MRTISLPFRFDGYGHVSATSDMQKIWADRVRSVVATSLGSRLMRPAFGCPTPIQMFQSTTGIQSVLDVDVATAFATWLPDLNYTGLDFEWDVDTAEVRIVVNYEVPGNATSENSVNIVVEVE